jgi:hypothetical protein
MKIAKWINTKTGPRMAEVNAEDQYKTGWTKEPCFMTILHKPYDELVYSRWQDLTVDQTTAIYNHQIKWTTNTAGKYDHDHTRYIFFESRGTFEIRYSDDYAKFTLSFISGTGLKFHLAANPDNMGNQAAIKWLKHFTQYLIDEPEELNVLICRQIPITPYVNIPCFVGVV